MKKSTRDNAADLLPDFSPRLKIIALQIFDRVERGLPVKDKEIINAISIWQVMRHAGKWESS